jgi:hypothetical protein
LSWYLTVPTLYSYITGIHSGPVTAGVLRGDRSRFQLFGDTMNTASRMESTGKAGSIHVSQDTADLLIRAGKAQWLRKREDAVVAKGKGRIETYWIHINQGQSGSSTGESDSMHESQSYYQEAATLVTSQHGPQPTKLVAEKCNRLIHWNVDVLRRLLVQIAARKQLTKGSSHNESRQAFESRFNESRDRKMIPLQEVKDIIELPAFDVWVAKHQAAIDIKTVTLSETIEQELRDYVTSIASMYRDNPFHNFEHASHVAMSVVKLLSRIVAPSEIEIDESHESNGKQLRAKYASTLHDHTYGITSDPLTQFACVLSALVHDVDHTGVPNLQLIQEKAAITAMYKNKSVAEQNSIDLAWDLLMDDSYINLRSAIYANEVEMRRFRQLLINSVMATDIMDKELSAQRKARWNTAFHESCNKLLPQEVINRKATIVIEHLIQASDIAHTMQHWHIYRKWNERLFMEMYKAYVSGRGAKDPTDFWYEGEIGFFDFYIIPLAKKLKDCGVFGVSSEEYLQYAEKNRKEWEEKGKQVTQELHMKARSEYLPHSKPQIVSFLAVDELSDASEGSFAE